MRTSINKDGGDLSATRDFDHCLINCFINLTEKQLLLDVTCICHLALLFRVLFVNNYCFVRGYDGKQLRLHIDTLLLLRFPACLSLLEAVQCR